jgi:hypothetical protein
MIQLRKRIHGQLEVPAAFELRLLSSKPGRMLGHSHRLFRYHLERDDRADWRALDVVRADDKKCLLAIVHFGLVYQVTQV